MNARDFAALARQVSEHDESAVSGGDLGFLTGDRRLPELRAAPPAVRAGEVVGPIKTAQGIHFVHLIERRAGVVPAFVEVRERRIRALRQSRAADLEQACLREAAAPSGISVNELELAKLRERMGQ